MTKDILKRLTYTFLLTFAISMTFAGIKYQATKGNEAKQAAFIDVVVIFILCVLNLLVSLPSLLNLYPTVRQDFKKSLLAFIFFPLLLLLAIVIMFVTEHNKSESILDLFSLAYVSILFISILTFQFYRFRRTFK